MLALKYRKKGRPRQAPLTSRPPLRKRIDFLGWLKQQNLLTDAEIDVICKFNALYQKVLTTYGLKSLKTSLPLAGVAGLAGHWQLSESDEKKWRQVIYTQEMFTPEAWRVLKLLAEMQPLQGDLMVISRHLQTCRLLIQSLHKIL